MPISNDLLVEGYGLTFVAAGRKGLVEISNKLNYVFRRTVLSSCNGLVLESHDGYHVNLYITNPVTTQHFALPPFLIKVLCYGHAIAYAATSMEYKVVRTFYARSLGCHSFVPQNACLAILTVGVDKDWTRCVNTQHVSPRAKQLLLSKQALTTEGFVHWAQNGTKECVLTLNIETEIISEFPVPSIRHDGEAELLYYFLPMESYLSLLIARSEFSWEFWEMKPETGEWTKRSNIDFEAQFASSLNCILIPVGWLKCREVLVFCASSGNWRINYFLSTLNCIACNVRTHEFVKFDLFGGLNSFLVHRNSLAWMDGC